MNQEQLIAQAQRLIVRNPKASSFGYNAEVIEFLKSYAGCNSSFGKIAERAVQSSFYPWDDLADILRSFVDYVENGLYQGISPERKAQLDVVSDFLEMADTLLKTSGVHPAAAAVLIGATLEEFLRNWVESEDLSLDDKKPCLEVYSQVLRGAELVTKQDGKDITSWSGTRNHAAHGEWEEVSDKKRITLMLEGVNLFMRKYTPQ